MTAPPNGAPELWSAAFRRQREASWRELERLVSTIERRGLSSLPPETLAQLPVHYRAALSALSVARAICLDRALLDYLESLCARAYLCVYGPRQRLLSVLWDLAARRFPRAVRRCAGPIAVAAAALLLGAATAFVLCRGDLGLYWHFVDDDMAQGRDPTATTDELRATLFDADAHDGGSLAMFAAFLFGHNSRITLLAFGLGLLGGVPALLLLFVNGMVLGAMSALFHERGLAVEWWSWILPHGITELSAVAFGGGAGLVLADALVFPGRHGRLHTLAARGREAGILAFGTVGMLFAAGILEGIFRQVIHSVPVRYFLAMLTAALWVAFFAFGGRRRP